MKQESKKLSQTQSELLSQRESTTPHKAAKRDRKPAKKDFVSQVKEILLLNLKANTDRVSMDFERSLKIDAGKITLADLRKILVCSGIRKITINNASIKTIN
jgi:uncharacterized protein YcbK (DUF882 family)